MRHNRKFLILTLMSSSILLLLILQFLWIRSEYRAAEDTFRQETNLVFRHTIRGLVDSLFMTRVELLRENDSTVRVKRMYFPRPDEYESDALDSLKNVLKIHKNKPIIMFSGDSTMRFHNRPASKRRSVVMIRVNSDSLNVGSISNKYRLQLKEIDRNVAFKVVKKGDARSVVSDTTFITDFVKIGPGSPFRYAASFEGVKPYLLKEIYPQITFSALLILLIVAAFVVLFKNLQLQQRLISQKDDFISNVSHELKTPIATVNVALEALTNFKALDNPALTEEYLDIAKRETDRLSAMTDKILNAAVHESKGIDINNERVDFEMLVNKILDQMKVVWDERNITVDTAFSGSDFTLTGSREHLTNVIHNLLDNAVKYSPKPAHIKVFLKDDGHDIILKISDNGFGIPEAYHKKIFEKFFRVPHGDIHNVKGYGLGLSYVVRVVEAHTGSIDIESEHGKGSTFVIKLPKNV